MSERDVSCWEISKDSSSLGAHYWLSRDNCCGAMLSLMTAHDPGYEVSREICEEFFRTLVAAQSQAWEHVDMFRQTLGRAALDALNVRDNDRLEIGERPVLGFTFSTIVRIGDRATIANLGSNTVLMVGERGFNELIPTEGTFTWGAHVALPERSAESEVVVRTLELEIGQWILCAPASSAPHSGRFETAQKGRAAIEEAITFLAKPYPRFAKAWLATGRM